jgi:hypothetical protein
MFAVLDELHCAPLAFTSACLLAVGAETAIAAERHEAGGSE